MSGKVTVKSETFWEDPCVDPEDRVLIVQLTVAVMGLELCIHVLSSDMYATRPEGELVPEQFGRAEWQSEEQNMLDPAFWRSFLDKEHCIAREVPGGVLGVADGKLFYRDADRDPERAAMSDCKFDLPVDLARDAFENVAQWLEQDHELPE